MSKELNRDAMSGSKRLVEHEEDEQFRENLKRKVRLDPDDDEQSLENSLVVTREEESKYKKRLEEWREEDKTEEEIEQRYWEAVGKCKSKFDLEDLRGLEEPEFGAFFSLYSAREEDYTDQVLCYVKLGIHRYNMLHGKDLQLSSMVKYNYAHDMRDFTRYYITCFAKDPHCASPQLFEIGVSEDMDMIGHEYKDMSVWCFIARPKPESPEENHSLQDHAFPSKAQYLPLPQWPSKENFKNQTRFYWLKESELQKYDWIHLYLQIAFLKAHLVLSEFDVSQLVIKSVAVESGEENDTDPPNESSLEKSCNLTFFITFKYFAEKLPCVGSCTHHICTHHSDLVAIVRRVFDKISGRLSLTVDTTNTTETGSRTESV